MSTVKTFFRHCPSCGHRFEVKLVGKRQLSGESEFEKSREPLNAEDPLVSPISSSLRGVQQQADASVKVDVLNIEETEELAYTYKCKHCGHEWTEEKFRATGRRPPEDYKGD